MLKTKQVGEYTCTQFGPLQSIRLRLYTRQTEEMKIEDPDLLSLRQEWAFMASCTEPFISWDEYLATPLEETQPISEAVAELNTGLSGLGDGPQTKKKPKDRPPKSTIK